MPPKILFRIGLTFFVVATAIYFSTGRWLDSRIFVPLRYSVSLDNRQLKSEPFEINLSETYGASLELDESVDDYYEDNRCNYKTILYPRWRVYKFSSASAQSRELWVSSEQLTRSDGSLSNAFFASPGQYQLEWEIPVAAPCLNPRHPRLLVLTDSFGYWERIRLTQLFCLFLGGTGLALFVVAGQHVARWKFSRVPSLRIFPDMVLRNVKPIAKHAPIRVIHELPHWGLIWGSVLWIVIFIFIFVVSGRLPSKGLFVSWQKPDAVVWEKSPWPDTLEVYVQAPARFFVNSEEVKRNDLRSKLNEQLGHRVEWTVYLEANADTSYMDAVYAIDVIQGCGAKLVWVTPKMREQWRHKPESSPKN
jgi:biopolymer transport protein ExbD